MSDDSALAARPLRSERRVLLAAPVVFAAHVYEEYPGFVEFMSRRTGAMSLSQFLLINALAFAVTLALSVATALRGGRALALALVGWLSFLMLANGVLHLAACALESAYVPGALTAAVLYLPYFALALLVCRGIGGLGARAAATAALLGAIPMLAQGAGVLLLGRRVLW